MVRHEHGHRTQPSPLRKETLQPQQIESEIIRATNAHEGVLLNLVYDIVPQLLHVHEIVLQPEPPQDMVHYVV